MCVEEPCLLMSAHPWCCCAMIPSEPAEVLSAETSPSTVSTLLLSSMWRGFLKLDWRPSAEEKEVSMLYTCHCCAIDQGARSFATISA